MAHECYIDLSCIHAPTMWNATYINIFHCVCMPIWKVEKLSVHKVKNNYIISCTCSQSLPYWQVVSPTNIYGNPQVLHGCVDLYI